MYSLNGSHTRRDKVEARSLSPNSSLDEQAVPFLAHDTELEKGLVEENCLAKKYLYVNISLLILSVIFFLGSVIVQSRRFGDKECATHLSAYSPVMEAVEYEWVTFENEFSTAPTKYRGKPTADLEQAWTELWKYGAFPVGVQHLGDLNQSSEVDWRRVTPGDPRSPTVGLLEGFHQIHCLNLIRQYTYREEWDYSSEASWHGGPEMVRWHVDHCIETLRMNLMCTADVTPYLIWNDPAGFNGESPSFNTLHKCRKWEPIVEWVKQNVIFNGTAKEGEHGNGEEHHIGQHDVHEHGHTA
ncbi:hypothetical protein N7539_000670 [Penicillium diatomitis]|uniref:Uncharacterized protein n=1 Tax=Penicillium diatomitis TaxID=2819901 RepID=A0A9W9XM93_9EURO|nr:uncharacterized protein N7539_000670 [Penicillium diatomitis]KAJ5495554.1 hypothetical protein N7539_000670 [Penicillium diatomitis]